MLHFSSFAFGPLRSSNFCFYQFESHVDQTKYRLGIRVEWLRIFRRVRRQWKLGYNRGFRKREHQTLFLLHAHCSAAGQRWPGTFEDSSSNKAKPGRRCKFQLVCDCVCTVTWVSIQMWERAKVLKIHGKKNWLCIFSKRQALSRAVVNGNLLLGKNLAREGPGSRLCAGRQQSLCEFVPTLYFILRKSDCFVHGQRTWKRDSKSEKWERGRERVCVCVYERKAVYQVCDHFVKFEFLLAPDHREWNNIQLQQS